MADVVVRPQSEEEIAAVVTAAVGHRMPYALRGGGTGNYGQSVPLKGGVLLDMTGLQTKWWRSNAAAFASRRGRLLAKRSRRRWHRANN